MTSSDDGPQKAGPAVQRPAHQAREARRAVALRENLKRRKAQLRHRTDAAAEDPAQPEHT